MDFTHGTIIDNLSEIGEYFNIIVRTQNDLLVEVSDSMVPGEPERALGEQLTPGETYHLLLALIARRITLPGILSDESLLDIPTKEHKYLVRNQNRELIETRTYLLNEIAWGKVIDPHWAIATLSNEQQQVLSVLQSETYLLLETAIGHLIISYDYLNESLGDPPRQIETGEYITWQPAGVDLLAILEPYLAI